MARDYNKIKAWQLADELAIKVYKLTQKFPRDEVFGLTSQMRRAAVSVPANIVEGSARQYQREYLQFLYISMGSLAELGYYIKFSYEIGYLNKEDYDVMDLHYIRTIKTLRALINFIEKNKKVQSPESEVQSPRSKV
jgi:four helix bundle protein